MVFLVIVLLYLACFLQNDQGVEGSADFGDTDHSSGIGDDEDAEGSGDGHLTDEELGSGTPTSVFAAPKVVVVTDTKKPKGAAIEPSEVSLLLGLNCVALFFNLKATKTRANSKSMTIASLDSKFLVCSMEHFFNNHV